MVANMYDTSSLNPLPVSVVVNRVETSSFAQVGSGSLDDDPPLESFSFEVVM